MKKKPVIIGSVVLIILLCIFLIWYFVWHDSKKFMTEVKSEDVEKIVVSDGNKGVEFEITSREEIDELISAWNKASLQQTGTREGEWTGYDLIIMIYSRSGDGDLFDLSSNTVIKNEMIYEVTEGDSKYQYLQDKSEEVWKEHQEEWKRIQGE